MRVEVGEDPIKAATWDLYIEDFTASFLIGLEAHNFNTPNIPVIRKGISSEALHPFQIPNVFVDGPQINELVELQIALTATGNLKTGISMYWEKAEAHVDLLKDDKANTTGWDPKTEKTFELTDGQIGLNASLSIPHSFGCGINIFNSLIDKEVKVENYAGVQLDMIANYEGNVKRGYKYNDREHARDLIPAELVRKDEEQCKAGIQFILSLFDRLRVEVVGFFGYNVMKQLSL